jgi:acyl carrier protein
MTELSTRVRSVLAGVFGVGPEMLEAESAMDTVDGWDSFTHVQAIVALEAEFGVKFQAWRIPEITTVERIEAELRVLGA